jgi:hypothetical protein
MLDFTLLSLFTLREISSRWSHPLIRLKTKLLGREGGRGKTQGNPMEVASLLA